MADLRGPAGLAVSMGVMNLGTYGFTLLAARLLGPAQYGELAALMGVLLVVNVVSLGLQATAARRLAAHPSRATVIGAQMTRASRRAAAGVGLLCLATAPLADRVLDLGSAWTAILVAATAVPLTLVGGQAGLLQGRRQWTGLAAVYAAVGLGRLGLGALALWASPTAVAGMLGVAVAAWLPVVAGGLALRAYPVPAPPAAGPGPVPAGDDPHVLAETARHSHTLLAFFVLANLDVVLARTVLAGDQAGLYAGGLIVTKAVLFLPQFVVVLAFPSMAAGLPGRGYLGGLGLVAAAGTAAALAAWAAPGVAVAFVGGSAYAGLAASLWVFAVVGALWAAIQLMVYQGAARQSRAVVWLLWVGAAAMTAAAGLVSSRGQLLGTVAVTAAAVLAGLLLMARTAAGRAAQDASPGVTPGRR